MFKTHNIPTSQGWDRTLDRLRLIDDLKIQEAAEAILLEHTIFGEKFAKFYNISNDQKAKLQELFERVTIPESIFSAMFPCEVDHGNFDKVDIPQILVAKYSNDDGMGIVFTSQMKLTSREKIEDDEILSIPASIRQQYDEIIGFKLRSVQLFNVIWIPHHDNLLEVRIDNPPGMPLEAAHQIHSVMKAIVNEMLETTRIESARDLFPLIDSIYTSDEGKVVELGFSTSTGSVKLEKMRRTKTCLREELYHVGGKRELKTKISPYKISVQWSFGGDELEFRPELTLAGTSRGQHSISSKQASPQVTGASVANCIGAVDYEHVRERIADHLARVSADRSDEVQPAAE